MAGREVDARAELDWRNSHGQLCEEEREQVDSSGRLVDPKDHQKRADAHRAAGERVVRDMLIEPEPLNAPAGNAWSREGVYLNLQLNPHGFEGSVPKETRARVQRFAHQLGCSVLSFEDGDVVQQVSLTSGMTNAQRTHDKFVYWNQEIEARRGRGPHPHQWDPSKRVLELPEVASVKDTGANYTRARSGTMGQVLDLVTTIAVAATPIPDQRVHFRQYLVQLKTPMYKDKAAQIFHRLPELTQNDNKVEPVTSNEGQMHAKLSCDGVADPIALARQLEFDQPNQVLRAQLTGRLASRFDELRKPFNWSLYCKEEKR